MGDESCLQSASGDDFWAHDSGTQYGWVVRNYRPARYATRFDPTAILKPIFKASTLAARRIVFLLLYFVGLLKKPF